MKKYPTLIFDSLSVDVIAVRVLNITGKSFLSFTYDVKKLKFAISPLLTDHRERREGRY